MTPKFPVYNKSKPCYPALPRDIRQAGHPQPSTPAHRRSASSLRKRVPRLRPLRRYAGQRSAKPPSNSFSPEDALGRAPTSRCTAWRNNNRLANSPAGAPAPHAAGFSPAARCAFPHVVLRADIDVLKYSAVPQLLSMISSALRTASSSDARRRLQVLLAGSVVGLGSVVIIFG